MERLIDAKPSVPTKERILDAAEALFAERGFGETSLRDITSTAGVNLAAVNYHFQSKDALIHAVFARRLGPLNRRRLEVLSEFEAGAGDGPLPIENVLRAFLDPMVRGVAGNFTRLLGRMYGEPGDLFNKTFRDQFGEARERFVAAFQRALPGQPLAEILWKLHFTVGAMAHTLAGLHHLDVISGGLCDPTDTEALAARLIAFLAAGFKAEPPSTPTPEGYTCVIE